MELQTAFYIIGIIFMSVMLILLVALVVAVFVIRARVVAIHDRLEEKINQVTNIATLSGELLGSTGAKLAKSATNQVKKAVAKSKKK